MAEGSSRIFLIKDHLQGVRVGIKNWPALSVAVQILESNKLVQIEKFNKWQSARVPFFYTRVGKSIRLGICVSRYILINDAKLSC
jgi:hypothetical protein